MGRTGQWFGFQSDNILPDVITLAKGLGGGMPIGACVATKRAQLLTKGMHGTTFGGNPVCAAAANAVISTLRQDNVLEQVRELGEYLSERLAQHTSVTQVRGRGLMLGVVLDRPLKINPVDFGLIVNCPKPDVIRIVPPLTLTRHEAEHGVQKILEMLDANAENSQPAQPTDHTHN